MFFTRITRIYRGIRSIFSMKKATKGKAKVEKVMKEFKSGKLHSGSKKGPLVTSKKQGIAIALSESRKAGSYIPKKGKKK